MLEADMFETVIAILAQKNETISVMESCTGGAICNAITNITGSSDVFRLGMVTYSNEFKIKYGLSEKILNKYTVYSKEVAREMARVATINGESDYGLGITGRLNQQDRYNPYGESNLVFFCIYDKKRDVYIDQTVSVSSIIRTENKSFILRIIDMKLRDYLKMKK